MENNNRERDKILTTYIAYLCVVASEMIISVLFLIFSVLFSAGRIYTMTQ